MDPVAAVVAAVGVRTGTRWIGVDGKGASGKSTLAARIAAALPGSVVVHVDDFARRDIVGGWDRDRFVVQVLDPLRAGRPASYQRWDWEADRGADWHEIPVGVPVVVEGVSSTDVRVEVPWDVTVWVEVPASVRWQRVLDRDDGLLDRWLSDWIPGEDTYEAAQHPQDRVDLVWRPDG